MTTRSDTLSTRLIPKTTTEAQIAWVAGIIEGEGCVSWKENASSANVHTGTPAIKVVMTDKDVIFRLAEWTNLGNVHQQKDRLSPMGNECKTQYSWLVQSRPEAKQLLERIRPWMMQRRRGKVDEALAGIERDEQWAAWRDEHFICGHEKTFDNTKRKGSSLYCKTCLRVQDANYARRKRAEVKGRL